jgi:acyl-CoA synthetase (AMP-forming)/AMP-acid ligase II
MMNSLWDSFTPSRAAAILLHGRGDSVALTDLAAGSTLGGMLESLRGASVLIATQEQLPTAVALLELDGVARRMVLCTPDLTPQQLAEVAHTTQAAAVILDSTQPVDLPASVARCVATPQPTEAAVRRRSSEQTEWILLTSGTTGTPKLVVHTLSSLAGTLPRQPPAAGRLVWSTFYDIRRYGGLQIYLRAMLGGVPLVLSSPEQSTREFFLRAATAGVTHISGTPSHWRRALMSGDAGLLQPEYVRLSGEIADQSILDNLRAAYPHARIAHAFASTEAGVAFEVEDGLAGFPADIIEAPRGGIDLKVQDGTLRIRSGRNAARYLGGPDIVLASDDGYVDTGDLVELVEGRYHFRGRKGGIINVGGLKVYPEEVEAVLNADPRVRMSQVRARRNPITGAVVVADVVLADPDSAAGDGAERIKAELLGACRRQLSGHKVPATLRFVPTLELTSGGKLVRPNA